MTIFYNFTRNRGKFDSGLRDNIFPNSTSYYGYEAFGVRKEEP